jgi:hypothetical protein
MFAYCLGALHLSDDAAYKRIQAARAARRFPAIFDAVAEGRLSLTAVVRLAPHLREHNAAELMAAATHKTKLELEKLLAERFPRPDMPARVEAIPQGRPPWPAEQPGSQTGSNALQLVPEPVGALVQLVPEPVQVAAATELAPGQADPASATPPVLDRSKVQPLAPGRYGVQFTMSRAAYDKLCYLQDLLGFDMPSDDLGRLFEEALDAKIRDVEKQKLAATSQPRQGQSRGSKNPRHIPARVRRAVWKRDGARCTFVGESGRRCEATKGLQFDHVLEVARGGEASVEDIRLRCWAHNQYTAERTFGAEFMRHKRLAAAGARATAKAGRARSA